MKRRTKVIAALATIVFVQSVLPRLIVWLAPVDMGMGLCLLLFFVGIPLMNLLLGILAGGEMRKLWWIPVVSAISFPFLFALAMWELVLVLALMVYVPFYLCIGVVSMLITHLCNRYMKKHIDKHK